MSELIDPTTDEERRARAGEAMLTRGLRRARLAIFWEQLWPALASIATAIGLFLAREILTADCEPLLASYRFSRFT